MSFIPICVLLCSIMSQFVLIECRNLIDTSYLISSNKIANTIRFNKREAVSQEDYDKSKFQIIFIS